MCIQQKAGERGTTQQVTEWDGKNGTAGAATRQPGTPVLTASAPWWQDQHAPDEEERILFS